MKAMKEMENEKLDLNELEQVDGGFEWGRAIAIGVMCTLGGPLGQAIAIHSLATSEV